MTLGVECQVVAVLRDPQPIGIMQAIVQPAQSLQLFLLGVAGEFDVCRRVPVTTRSQTVSPGASSTQPCDVPDPPP